MEQKKFIFLGGSGRSGTSAYASLLQSSTGIYGLHDVELKLFNEAGGITDLYDAFVINFSFSRAKERLAEFKTKYVLWLFSGDNFGQKGLDSYIEKKYLEDQFDVFSQSLLSPYLRCLSLEDFSRFVYNFLINSYFRGSGEFKYLLEKTPHIILDMDRLTEIFPGSVFISVIRDPRLVVLSLMKFDWAGDGSLDKSIYWLKGYLSAYLKRRNSYLNRSNFLEIKHENSEGNLPVLEEFFIRNGISISMQNLDFKLDSNLKLTSENDLTLMSNLADIFSEEMFILDYQT